MRKYWILTRKVCRDRPWSYGVEHLELYQNIASCDSSVSIILRSQERSGRASQLGSWQTAKEAAIPLKTLHSTASLNFRIRLPVRLYFSTQSLLDARFPVPSLALKIVHRMRLALRRCGTPPGHLACSLTSGRNTFG